jgi:membrane protein implicated in regulation of membrane protease activity
VYVCVLTEAHASLAPEAISLACTLSLALSLALLPRQVQWLFSAFVSVCACVRACVCVRERERETGKSNATSEAMVSYVLLMLLVS